LQLYSLPITIDARLSEFNLRLFRHVDQKPADANGFHLLGHSRHFKFTFFGANLQGFRCASKEKPGKSDRQPGPKSTFHVCSQTNPTSKHIVAGGAQQVDYSKFVLSTAEDPSSPANRPQRDLAGPQDALIATHYGAGLLAVHLTTVRKFLAQRQT
jgi:hypothetical protein